MEVTMITSVVTVIGVSLGIVGIVYGWLISKGLSAISVVSHDVLEEAIKAIEERCKTEECKTALRGVALNKERMKGECGLYNSDKIQRMMCNVMAAVLMAMGIALVGSLFPPFMIAGAAMIADAKHLYDLARKADLRAKAHKENFDFYGTLFDKYRKQVRKFCHPVCQPDLAKPTCEMD
jgi:hypothetical protein